MAKTAISSINGNFFSEFGCCQVVTEFPFMEEWQMLKIATGGQNEQKARFLV